MPYGPGAGVLVIDRSAVASAIVVTAVELLFAGFGSAVDVVTVAVLLLGPTGAAAAICTTMSNVARSRR